MMQIQRHFVATRVAMAIVLVALTASATDQAFPPVQICQNEEGSQDVIFDGLGRARNSSSTSPGFMACGLGQDQALDTNDDVLVFYLDQNSTNWQNVECGSAEVADDYSTLIFNPSVFGCSTAGGCASEVAGYQGGGYIRLVDVRHGGSYFTAVECSLPVNPAPFTWSFIDAITLDEQ